MSIDDKTLTTNGRNGHGTPENQPAKTNGNGINGIAPKAKSQNPKSAIPEEGYVLITGGAGFVGTNLAHRLLGLGHRVMVYDNLSRDGVERNLRWLKEMHGSQVIAEAGDVRDAARLARCVQGASHVFHFAAQVAVTTSLTDPVGDFEVNARGTLNLLEALRGMENPPPLFFTSTNKVYGSLEDVPMRKSNHRYEPLDAVMRQYGVSEARPLDFHSPYGCSKGAADQYVVDYARTYGIPAVVFRMSCIYGPHQFGTEDQGWVAHFLISALKGEPITLYGDGMQVRDILYVEDLVDALLLAQSHVDSLAGQAFNMGGGPENSVSLLEVIDMIARLHGERPQVLMGGWRPGDQRYYVSDTSRFEAVTGWKAKVGARQGIGMLYRWLQEASHVAHAPHAPGRQMQAVSVGSHTNATT